MPAQQREAGEAGQGVRVVLSKGGEDAISMLTHDISQSSLDLRNGRGATGRRLDDIRSMDSLTYPPTTIVEHSDGKGEPEWAQFGSLSQYQQSAHSLELLIGESVLVAPSVGREPFRRSSKLEISYC